MNILISVVLGLIAATHAYNIEKFSIHDEDQHELEELMNILMRPRVPERQLPDEYFKHFRQNPKTRLQSFSFKNCGDPATETFKLLQFNLSPDPIVLPGQIDISFSVQNLMMAGSPLQVDVKLKKKILGLWIEVPCIDNIGSCSYPDACELLDQIQCPEAFQENSIPCSCPIPMGNFTLPESKFEVDLSDIPTGDYSAQFSLSLNSGSTACYEVDITLG